MLSELTVITDVRDTDRLTRVFDEQCFFLLETFFLKKLLPNIANALFVSVLFVRCSTKTLGWVDNVICREMNIDKYKNHSKSNGLISAPIGA